jgi:hypothetical protein
VIDDTAQLTSITSASEYLPWMPFSLPHRLDSVGADPVRENHAGELQFSMRDNTWRSRQQPPELDKGLQAHAG